MRKKFANLGLSIQLHFSKTLTIITVINFFIALFSLSLLCVQHAGYAWLLPFILVYARFIFHRECTRLSPQAIIHCQYVACTYWWLTSRAGKRFLVKKVGKAYRTPWLVIVFFQKITNNRRVTLVMPKDAMTPSEYRYLTAILWEPYQKDQ